MPPKNASKGGNAQSKKTENKKKDRIIEDKTFGLKNKKGAKQQKFIQQVQHQVKSSGINKTTKQLEKEREDAKKEKERKKNDLSELSAILRPVQQAAGKGVDPKSVLCAFFKVGTCGKGAKCKFSHDKNIEKKVEKRSAYCDTREETNEEWDEDKLKEVVSKKHGSEKTIQTVIICRFFLDAVENNKYGWFWQCSNGEDCKYRHALPAGFVLKKDRKKAEKNKEKISIEDLVERERAALGANTTKVTLVSFLAWKKKKLKEKKAEEKKKNDKKKNDYKSGKEGGISGREMFMFDPTLVDMAGDDVEEGEGDAFDMKLLKGEEGDEDEEKIQYREINFDELMSEYRDDAANTSGEAAAGFSKEGGDVAIDEDLFADDDLESLDDDLDDLVIG